MTEIDIRGNKTSKISRIRFSDEEHFGAVVAIDHRKIYIIDGDGCLDGEVLIKDIDNLILALKKAKESGVGND